MATKFSLGDVVSSHYGTLYDAATSRPSKFDYFLVIGVPVLATGALVSVMHVRVVAAGQVLAGVAILGGFMFGLLTFVFQLRLSAANDPRIPHGGRLPRLLDEIFYNVAYTALVAFLTVALTLAPLALGSAVKSSTQDQPLNVFWSALIIGITIHFFVNLTMCVKRTFIAYAAYSNL